MDTGEQGPTQQAGPPVQNELYFHNDYNVAQCSCQEKAHPSEDCEQPKTTLLSHPCYSSLSLSLSLTAQYELSKMKLTINIPISLNVFLNTEYLPDFTSVIRFDNSVEHNSPIDQ